MNPKVLVRPYEALSGHSYISDLGFKAFLDLYDFEVEHIQYQDGGVVRFVYNISPEAMQEHVKDYFNSSYSRFKIFMDNNRTLIHGVIKQIKGE